MHSLRFWLDHRWAPDRMSDYLDGGLGEEERSRLKRHVGECADCRRVLAGLTQVVDALHRMTAPRGAPAAVEIAASVRLRLDEPT